MKLPPFYIYQGERKKVKGTLPTFTAPEIWGERIDAFFCEGKENVLRAIGKIPCNRGKEGADPAVSSREKKRKAGSFRVDVSIGEGKGEIANQEGEERRSPKESLLSEGLLKILYSSERERRSPLESFFLRQTRKEGEGAGAIIFPRCEKEEGGGAGKFGDLSTPARRHAKKKKRHAATDGHLKLD